MHYNEKCAHGRWWSPHKPSCNAVISRTRKTSSQKCGQKDKKRRNEAVKFKNILQKHSTTAPRLRSRVHFSFRDNLSQINKSFLRRFLVAESSASAAGICWLFCRVAELIKSAFGWHIDSSDSRRRRWRMLVHIWMRSERDENNFKVTCPHSQEWSNWMGFQLAL